MMASRAIQKSAVTSMVDSSPPTQSAVNQEMYNLDNAVWERVIKTVPREARTTLRMGLQPFWDASQTMQESMYAVFSDAGELWD